MPINSFIYPGAKVTPAYEVANSCRFDDGSSAYMHKTPGSEGNKRKWTFSTWYKKGNAAIDGNDGRWITVGADANNRDIIYHGSTNMIGFMGVRSGSASFDVYTINNIHRDVSAWYHLVVAVDTEQATAANRVKMYLNNVQLTASNVLHGSTSYPAEDLDTYFCDDVKHIIGKEFADTTYFDGYLAETILVDGSQLTPSSFGEFDEDSPTIWKPKDVSGLTFGTNGFYLDYEDSSNLGNDANGGTDLTEVNLAAADQATDTPTNNFCTLNPLDPTADITLSEGNLKGVYGTSGTRDVQGSTFGVSSGKWYWEVKIGGASSPNNAIVGVTQLSTDNNTVLGTADNSWGYRGYDGEVYHNNGSVASYATFDDTDIIGVYLDLDNHKLYFSKDGSLQSTTGISLDTGEDYFPAIADAGSSATPQFEMNFGGCPAFSISSGNTDGEYGNFEYSTTITGDSASKTFKALCTKNLAEFG